MLILPLYQSFANVRTKSIPGCGSVRRTAELLTKQLRLVRMASGERAKYRSGSRAGSRNKSVLWLERRDWVPEAGGSNPPNPTTSS